MKSVLVMGLATGMVVAGGSVVSAAVIGTDNTSASAYGDGWGSGDDGAVTGDAFGAWSLSTVTPGGFAGHFLGDSTSLSGGSGANINTTTNSFGMYGNQNTGAVSNSVRNFNGALSVGQTFSINLAVNFRNGNKGLDVRNASDVTIFNFNVGSDDHTIAVASPSGSTGSSYSNNTAFAISLTQTSATGGTWSVVRSGGVSDSDSGTYTGVAASFRAYVAGTDGGDANNLFINSMSIVPEPASLALLGFGVLGVMRRRH